MLISKSPKGATSEQLAVFSDKLGVELPKQLELFLEKYNGGETPATSFACNGISSDIVAFYGLGDVKYPFRNNTIVCLKYLPIAKDSFGNHILIDLISGAVSFQDHENDLITILTKDLRTFFDLCKSEEINPASQKSIEEREQDLIRRGRGHIITDDLRRMWQVEIDKYSNMFREEVRI